MATQAQNLSPEMILPAYKAPISPGPPILPSHYKSRATSHESRITSRLNPQESDCPESENVRRITYEFISKLCKTNPICKKLEYALTSFDARGYVENSRFSRAKANPNEPNLSRRSSMRSRNEPKANPIFRPSGPPEAKTNPNKPNLSRRSLPAAAKYSTKPGCEAGTNPICCRPALLPRPSAGPSRITTQKTTQPSLAQRVIQMQAPSQEPMNACARLYHPARPATPVPIGPQNYGPTANASTWALMAVHHRQACLHQMPVISRT